MTNLSLWFLLPGLLPCLNGFALEPGVGLRSADGSMHVVIFEHTESYGTGALVLNQPTPLRLKDLQIPRFHKAFAENSLMLGGGVTNDREETNVALTDMSPWFWIHTVQDLPKSIPLSAAHGPLFLGGNIETATEWIQQGKTLPSDFKFFYKFKQWGPGELVQEICQKHLWTEVGPVQARKAVQIYDFPRVF